MAASRRTTAALGLITATVLAGLTLVSPAPVAAVLPERLVALLNPDEVVGTNEFLAAGGTGTAVLWRGSDAGTICFDLALDLGQEPGDNQPFIAQLHEGLPGSIGPVVAPLPKFPMPGEVASGCVGGLDPLVVSDVFSDPGRFYVQAVQGSGPDCTGLCEAKATRGQLQLAGVDCTIMGVAPGESEPAATATVPLDGEVRLVGAGFIPFLPTAVLFTRADGAELAVAVVPDGLGGVRLELFGRDVGLGRWTVTAPDHECAGAAILTVIPAAVEPGDGGIPDTAMVGPARLLLFSPSVGWRQPL